MAGLQLIQTYSSDSDEDEHNEKTKGDHKIVNKYINYITLFSLITIFNTTTFFSES